MIVFVDNVTIIISIVNVVMIIFIFLNNIDI
jgi:hypothetical protein